MPTRRSLELRALAQRVADALPADVVREVVLTGSVSRGVADELSDVELLVVVEELPPVEECLEHARRSGLEELDMWSRPDAPMRLISGHRDDVPIELVWWSRAYTEERLRRILAAEIVDGRLKTAEALAHGISLRTVGLLAEWQERLLDDAHRVLRIVFALNREWEPSSKRLAVRLEPLPVRPPRLADRIEAALAEPEPRRALLGVAQLAAEALGPAPPGPYADRARAWLAELAALLR